MLAVSIWWVVDAHKWFKGPKVNVEHAIHGNVIVGIGEEQTAADPADASPHTSRSSSPKR
jgi:hypothetical protein